MDAVAQPATNATAPVLITVSNLSGFDFAITLTRWMITTVTNVPYPRPTNSSGLWPPAPTATYRVHLFDTNGFGDKYVERLEAGKCSTFELPRGQYRLDQSPGFPGFQPVSGYLFVTNSETWLFTLEPRQDSERFPWVGRKWFFEIPSRPECRLAMFSDGAPELPVRREREDVPGLSPSVPIQSAPPPPPVRAVP